MLEILQALNSLKLLYDLAKSANDANLTTRINSAIADLQGRLLDLQIKTQDILEENTKLKASVADLKSALEMKAAMKYTQGAYHTRDDGPFCQLCWESDKKVIHLSRLATEGSDDKTPTNDPNRLVWYSCVFHTSMRAAWPIVPSKFIASLNQG